MDDLISYELIVESTFAPVAVFKFKDNTVIKVTIRRDMNLDYNIIYAEAKLKYITLKRKDKIKKLIK